LALSVFVFIRTFVVELKSYGLGVAMQLKQEQTEETKKGVRELRW